MDAQMGLKTPGYWHDKSEMS